ncbi:MAG: hypothetical protein RL748_2277 [Pseudomonadota bacterium]|jgi:glucose/arabinose dehydrogenase
MLFVDNLNFPTSIAQAPDGTLFVAESGLPFDGAPAGGRVLRIHADGSRTELLRDLRQPVNGLLWHDGGLIISEGGHSGRISRLDLASGQHTTLLDNLPGFGNYHTNMVAIGPDGKMYFGQGAMTNSGIIGADSDVLAWLREVRHHPDIPGYDITLGSQSATVQDEHGNALTTGGFAAFGSHYPAGTQLAGQTPCTASVMRANLDGSGLELVAWGIRNAYGLLFLPDGRLLATDQGTDVRGVRPVWNCPDFLYEIKAGAWYGWPDFFGGKPINQPPYTSPDGAAQPFLLQNHAALPAPQNPLLAFDVNACACKMLRIPDHLPYGGDLLVAQFGDERPMTGPPGPRVGRNLVRVDTHNWRVEALPALPASVKLQRPLDLLISHSGAFIYVVDFGEFEFTAQKTITARAGSGCIWKIPVDFMEHNIMTTVSFATDIAPMFAQFRDSMMWRFDLTRYADVKANYSAIQGAIGPNGFMPPPPYPPLNQAQADLFAAWVKQGFPE